MYLHQVLYMVALCLDKATDSFNKFHFKDQCVGLSSI